MDCGDCGLIPEINGPDFRSCALAQSERLIVDSERATFSVMKSGIRTALIMFLAATGLTAAAPAKPQFADWELVAKLCGKLEQIDRIPDKTLPDVYSSKNRPVKDATLIAYEGRTTVECCANSKVAGETKSNKSGDFEFKGLTKGYYWLVTTIDRQEYRMAIRIGQLQDKQPVCSQMSFALDPSGEFVLRIRAPGR
jgi:hypothetical protein